MNVDFTPNLVNDLREMWQYPFMVNAFRAGTIVAILAGIIGYYMVMRGQSFAGHTIATVGFPGAAAAAWLGISIQLGYFAFCLAAALVIALSARRRTRGFVEESAVIATVQAFALGAGYLFASISGQFVSGISGLLFGNFLGISSRQVMLLLAIAALCTIAVLLTARPLLFGSVDPIVAEGKGVPVRMLDVGFLLVLGLAVAEVSQITGALLVFALLVMPAATADLISIRPAPAIAISVAIALVIVWISLTVAYFSNYPIGFCVTSVGFLFYVVTRIVRRSRALVVA